MLRFWCLPLCRYSMRGSTGFLCSGCGWSKGNTTQCCSSNALHHRYHEAGQSEECGNLCGTVGWECRRGEAPTLPPVTAEDQPLALAKAAQACGLLKAQPGRSLREVLQQMSRILPGHEFSWMKVRAGMEMAVVDPVACLSGRSLEGFVITDNTILICPAEEAEKLVVEYACSKRLCHYQDNIEWQSSFLRHCPFESNSDSTPFMLFDLGCKLYINF